MAQTHDRLPSPSRPCRDALRCHRDEHARLRFPARRIVVYLLTIPRLSFILFVSTILLAVGSTLYTFFCPSRVKEFSRDQWCDQLGRSLLHYWPLAWKHRYLRLACAACYALGGAGALWVLGTKVWQTARFILQHSTVP